MKASITKPFVCCSNLHLVANPVIAFQNGHKVSFGCCFLAKNFFFQQPASGFLNVFSSQLFLILFSVASDTTKYGYLSVKLFCPADPNHRNRMLTTFFSAACSFRLTISAGCQGRLSFGVLSNSANVFE